MPTEAGRHQLYEKIATEWGPEHAAELMSHLPPVGWADVATKQDLDTQTAVLRAEMTTLGATLRTEMTTQGADLRTEMTTQGTDLRTEMTTQGTDLRTEMTTLRAEIAAGFEALRTEMHKDFADQRGAFDVQLRWMLGIVLTAFVGLTGVFTAIVNWLPR